jgi:sugar-specific transcriptional regulator TrmB
MDNKNRAELVELGLSPTEAQIYLVLLQAGSLTASAIANSAGLSRTAVYQIVCALSDKGLVESGAGYGSKFAAVEPERALSALIDHDEEALIQRKKVAETLSSRLAVLAEATESVAPVPEELIQVIRSSRAAVERYQRLLRDRNPTLEKIMRRGVRIRALYEKSALEDPAVKPYLSSWIGGGEEARIYDGELPHKMQIFDCKVALVPLIIPGEQAKTVVLRYPHLVKSLFLTFEYLWEKSEPLVVEKESSISKTDKTSGRAPKAEQARQRESQNGRRGKPRIVKTLEP